MQHTIYDDCDMDTARDVLVGAPRPRDDVEVEQLCSCAGRVLAEDIVARHDMPPFDRSPLDGYAFRAADVAGASPSSPVTLRVVEEVPAGAWPTAPVGPGTAVKIMTGAPIPEGADTVMPFEVTTFAPGRVTISQPTGAGRNVVRAGEDVRRGCLVARRGDVIDAGAMGALAAQGVERALVHARPRVGILSTGDELVPVGQPLGPGKIHDSSRYALEGALGTMGCIPVPLGIASDDEAIIAGKIREALTSCDAVILTGGVSVGDRDRTPAALDALGARTLVRDVALKPGGKCVYAIIDDGARDVLLCGLSGNPVSAMTNFHLIIAPALRRLAGVARPEPTEMEVALKAPFPKGSPRSRILWGKLEIIGGRAVLDVPTWQGNAVLSCMVGCDTLALVSAGSGPLPAGERLKGWRI